MSTQEEEFLQRLRATFKVEAEEHVQAMSAGLLVLERAPAGPEGSGALEAVFRHSHSLKGAARATNFAEVEAVCQALEDVFAAWRRREITLAPENFDAVHKAVDLIGSLVRAPDGGISPSDGPRVSAAVAHLGRLVPRAAAGLPAPISPAQIMEQFVQPGAGEGPAAAGPASSTPVEVPRGAFAETVRVSTPKLDGLLLKAEEMLAVKQAAAQRVEELRQFEDLFSQWTKRWGQVQGQFRVLEAMSAPVTARKETGAAYHRDGASPAALREFLEWNQGHLRALEGRLLSLSKAAAQDRHAVGKHVDDLLTDSKKLLMLPFSTLSDLFPKLVRDLSRDQGKDAELVIRGKEVEVDKRILEEMKDPLIHLLRNCIDHGIRPQQRGLPKKAPRGTISITVAPVNGSKVEIVVADDGSGIDVARVKECAVGRGVITTEEARDLDDRRAIDLIFLSEVSTSPIITEISGRGLGLAIVREKTEKLGGRVTVESPVHGGTTFRISLPLTMATFRGILVRTAGQTLVIPTAQVSRVARVDTKEIRTVENRETISLDGCAMSFVDLADVLELEQPQRTAKAAGHVPVVVLGSGERQIAFGVDEVLYDEEVLVKSLGNPLMRIRNIAGATLLASGTVAPILNAADLVKSARSGTYRPRSSRGAGRDEPPGEQKMKSVLLAEDSITSRMLLKGILEAAGYRVRTAVDGVDALTALRTDSFDVVISDVEMPRLNGFDLTTQIRGDKRLEETPVVLVTALSSTADRERGIEAGANAYIVKSSFDQSNLLEVVRRLAG